MNIFLLTHERELNRPTNTGSIALTHASELVKRIVWERTSPNSILLNLIRGNNAALVYTRTDAPSACIDDVENFIIPDGTWQESRKIVNKSPWLHQVPRITLHNTSESSFKLRRNQVQGGLCTVECIVELLKIKGMPDLADLLEKKYHLFNR